MPAGSIVWGQKGVDWFCLDYVISFANICQQNSCGLLSEHAVFHPFKKKIFFVFILEAASCWDTKKEELHSHHARDIVSPVFCT